MALIHVSELALLHISPAWHERTVTPLAQLHVRGNLHEVRGLLHKFKPSGNKCTVRFVDY